MNIENLVLYTPVLLLILAWTLPWKGVALWRAARNHQTSWFIALLVFNTLALLEIIYIFYFSKKPKESSSPENKV